MHDTVRKYREMNETYDFLNLPDRILRRNAENGLSGRLIISQLFKCVFTSLLVYFQVIIKMSEKKKKFRTEVYCR